jgi:hypothetical protein
MFLLLGMVEFFTRPIPNFQKRLLSPDGNGRHRISSAPAQQRVIRLA